MRGLCGRPTAARRDYGGGSEEVALWAHAGGVLGLGWVSLKKNYLIVWMVLYTNLNLNTDGRMTTAPRILKLRGGPPKRRSARVVGVGVRAAAARAGCGVRAAWAGVEGCSLSLARSLARSLSLSLSQDCQEWYTSPTFITGQSR